MLIILITRHPHHLYSLCVCESECANHFTPSIKCHINKSHVHHHISMSERESCFLIMEQYRYNILVLLTRFAEVKQQQQQAEERKKERERLMTAMILSCPIFFLFVVDGQSIDWSRMC